MFTDESIARRGNKAEDAIAIKKERRSFEWVSWIRSWKWKGALRKIKATNIIRRNLHNLSIVEYWYKSTSGFSETTVVSRTRGKLVYLLL
jgi:hypothetical protein